MRVGNTILNPRHVCYAEIIENNDWLGIQDGYLIQCKLDDGRKIKIKDSDGRGFTRLGADDALDEINDALEEE